MHCHITPLSSPLLRSYLFLVRHKEEEGEDRIPGGYSLIRFCGPRYHHMLFAYIFLWLTSPSLCIMSVTFGHFLAPCLGPQKRYNNKTAPLGICTTFFACHPTNEVIPRQPHYHGNNNIKNPFAKKRHLIWISCMCPWLCIYLCFSNCTEKENWLPKRVNFIPRYHDQGDVFSSLLVSLSRTSQQWCILDCMGNKLRA